MVPFSEAQSMWAERNTERSEPKIALCDRDVRVILFEVVPDDRGTRSITY